MLFADFPGGILQKAVSSICSVLLIEQGWLLSTKPEVSLSLPHFPATINEITCFRWFEFECCALAHVMRKSQSVVWLSLQGWEKLW